MNSRQYAILKEETLNKFLPRHCYDNKACSLNTSRGVFPACCSLNTIDKAGQPGVIMNCVC